MVDLNSGNIDVPPNMTSWPSFHNGVAAGLKIAPASQVGFHTAGSPPHQAFQFYIHSADCPHFFLVYPVWLVSHMRCSIKPFISDSVTFLRVNKKNPVQ